jgi:hypothetical protein
MSDRLLDAIRKVDPCPDPVAPPPLDIVMRRLLHETPSEDDPERSAARPRRRRRPRGALVAGTLSAAVAAAVAIVALVLIGHHHDRTAPAVRPSTSFTRPCRPGISDGVLPPWARGGFSARRPRIGHELGRAGHILAIVWGRLYSPPSRSRSNKINWVSHVRDTPGRTLHIEAQRMNGRTPVGAPVRRQVPGGPAPSIINLPSAGCWRLTLHWSGWVDQLDLRYGAPG